TFTPLGLPVEPDGTATDLTTGSDQLTWMGGKHLILRRADGAASWINFDGPPNNIVDLTVSPEDVRLWYAVCDPALGGPAAGLWRTTDGGASWTQVLESPTGHKLYYV